MPVPHDVELTPPQRAALEYLALRRNGPRCAPASIGRAMWEAQHPGCRDLPAIRRPKMPTAQGMGFSGGSMAARLVEMGLAVRVDPDPIRWTDRHGKTKSAWSPHGYKISLAGIDALKRATEKPETPIGAGHS